MFKKSIIYLLLFSFLNLAAGCYYEEQIAKEKIEENQKITEVILPSGKSIKFDGFGGKLRYLNSIIKGKGIDSRDLKITPNDVSEFRTRLYPADILQLSGKKISEVTWMNRKQYVFDEDCGTYQDSGGIITGKVDNLGDVSLFVKDLTGIYISKPDTASIERIKRDSTIRIKQVLYKNRVARTFNDDGGRYVPDDYFIEGVGVDGKPVFINIEDILYARVEKTDEGLTTLAVLGGCLGAAAVAVAITLATKESCPFVYSFDGDKYIFDAEPLGGATSIGLKRSEFSRLEHLKNIDGKYRLRIVNEVEETQYVDEMSLYVVDHPMGTEAVMNNDGIVYLTHTVESPFAATDENGMDLSEFLIKEDGIQWQTKMPVRESDKSGYTRNQLNFSFLRPREGDSLNLVMNAGTSLWGSNMIKEMLKLYGSEIGEWYDKIDQKKSEYYQMMSFLQGEELYELKVYVEEDSGWTEKTIIQGGGPFMTERRIIPIDISHVKGDTINIRVNPPGGFWSLDYLASVSGELIQAAGSEIKPSFAIDYKGADISEIIGKDDESYYEMPETGNSFDIECNAPEPRPDMIRTVFLKSSGYYKIHLPKDNPADYAKLYEIGMVPGSIVNWSYDKYIEWWKSSGAAAVSKQ